MRFTCSCSSRPKTIKKYDNDIIWLEAVQVENVVVDVRVGVLCSSVGETSLVLDE